jgi:two-component system, NtrC family, sensor kinase
MPSTPSLRAKILITLAAVACVFLVATWAIQEYTLLPSFCDLEHQQAQSNLSRATEALQKEVEHINDFAGDWSGWDDTYRFVEDGNQEFAKSNLESNVFREDSYDFLCFIRRDGNEAWRAGLAPDGTPTVVDELPKAPWPMTHPLLAPRTTSGSATGILLTKDGPLLLASRPITDSARTAEPRGWMLMGRFLNPKRIAALAAQTRLALTIVPTTSTLGANDRSALARLRSSGPREITALDQETLEAREFVPDLGGTEGLLVSVELPRKILASGRQALDFALLSTCVAVLFMFGALLYLLQRMVTGPLALLTRHALAIGNSDDLSIRCSLPRKDELGVLATEFDSMVGRLAETRARLVEQAREGGMSEVATSVLHDVGNAMQSVSASTGALRQYLDGRSVDDLERVSSLLAAHAQDLDHWLSTDPKGMRVPPFLLALSKSLNDEHVAMRAELAALTGALEHIQALVARQQEHAGKRGALERVSVAELLELAQRMSAGQEDDGVTFETRIAHVPPVRVEKHKLLAVLVNLIRNARQACQSSPVGARHVVLTLEATPDGGQRVVVLDSGIGIAAENIERIFQGGFTTKRNGRGLGLHGCANSVREMHGRLWAESTGPGLGARFCVELPAAVPELAESVA